VRTLPKAVRFPGWMLVVTGIIALAYCAWVFTDRWNYQRTESYAFDRALASGSVEATPANRTVAGKAGQSAIRYGEIFGRLRIPRVGLSVMVTEGDDEAALRHAAGHIPGTSMPGSPGNVAIAGHRDSLFRSLKEVRDQDLIVLSTLQGEFRYRVSSIRIVGPSDMQVLDSSGGQTLTLITCYPFYYVGAAPKRFIVRANRVAEDEGQTAKKTPV
jgi:sortase A